MHPRAVVSTGSTGSIEPVDFWKRHDGTFEISKIIKRIEPVNFQEMHTLEPEKLFLIDLVMKYEK